jgi:hypothetical protein
MTLFQMHGVAPAGPGNGVRQSTFSVLLHLVAMFLSFEMPSLLGPRHCGQLSALAEMAHNDKVILAKRDREEKRMIKRSEGGEGRSYNRKWLRTKKLDWIIDAQ